MIGQLRAGRGLNQPLEQILQQPIRADQILGLLVISEQLVEQLWADLCHDAKPPEQDIRLLTV